jgi:hypothetical protein
MLGRRTAVLLAALALLALLAIPALAATLPPEVQSVVDDFRNDGTITPCKHTVQALEETTKLKPADVAQVSPDFLPAVSAALEARQHDDCGAGKGGSSAAVAASRPTPTAAPSTGASPSTTAAPGASASPTAGASPTATPTVTAVPTATPVPTAAPAQAAVTTASGHDPFPVGLWILLALLALTAVLWLVALAVGRLGWGEERLAGSRHAWAEARYRAGGVWSDFTDWLRLGR